MTCWASSHIRDLKSDMEGQFKKVSARQDKLEADMREMNKKLDQLLTLLSPQAIPKRNLRQPSGKGNI